MATAIHRTIRSRRRTLALQVTEEGHLIVRAPHRLAETEILRFVEKQSAWVENKIHQAARRAKTAPPPLTAQEEKKLKSHAKDAFIERACFYARQMGVKFEKIRLSSAKTRWGSCGPQGNLNFHWRLINAPTDVLDYVVVHELSHLIQRNHSAKFWSKVREF